jgi:ABC-type polysaccharide/polyol phosphate transport system ATPase subunit
MAEPAIIVENVTKRFTLSGAGASSLKAAAIGLLRRRPTRRFTALENVSFDVSQGETLGIIGHNGAGKSTLLSLVAGVMQPTSGRIRTVGRISSLLELGAGFHPELTGRENVFLYGAVMGLKRAHMRKRFDAIVDFSGIGDFIDEPVKHYSSGMYVRLGFAVAVEVSPDILLVDEVLSVGDETFQRRCLERMRAFKEAGRTLLIVSHDLALIQGMSDRIVLLAKGGIQSMGAPRDVIGSYRRAAAFALDKGLTREWGTGEVALCGVSFLDEAGAETTRFVSGGPVTARIAYENRGAVRELVFGYSISDASGRVVCGSNTQLAGMAADGFAPRGTLELRLPSAPLRDGVYAFSFSVHSPDHKVNYHRLDCAYTLLCERSRDGAGPLDLPCLWGKLPDEAGTVSVNPNPASRS